MERPFQLAGHYLSQLKWEVVAEELPADFVKKRLESVRVSTGAAYAWIFDPRIAGSSLGLEQSEVGQILQLLAGWGDIWDCEYTSLGFSMKGIL